MQHRVISARTEGSNNEWTDRQKRVWHVVDVVCSYRSEDDGKDGDERIKVRHYSADPQAAMNEVSEMSQEQLTKLERVQL